MIRKRSCQGSIRKRSVHVASEPPRRFAPPLLIRTGRSLSIHCPAPDTPLRKRLHFLQRNILLTRDPRAVFILRREIDNFPSCIDTFIITRP